MIIFRRNVHSEEADTEFLRTFHRLDENAFSSLVNANDIEANPDPDALRHH
jgi:hypothetical protein